MKLLLEVPDLKYGKKKSVMKHAAGEEKSELKGPLTINIFLNLSISVHILPTIASLIQR